MMLEIRDLAVARGGVPVLAGVSFTLAAGAGLVLRGPNGIGKTTLLRTLAGLQPPLRGEISLAPDEMAYAGHADGVKAVLSVAENLQFWAEVHGATGIGAALAAYDLAPLAGRAAQTLSAGQRRRLGLARLLVTGRRVWLLDEPTVSLDAAAVAMFAQAAREHMAVGGAVLVATHVDLGLAGAGVLDLTPFRARVMPAATRGGGGFAGALG